MTTDPTAGESSPAGGWRARLTRWGAFSVRTRITVAFVAVAALALFSAGFFVYTIEVRAIERDVRDQIRQELAEFRTLSESDPPPADVDTGAPISTADQLVRVFLTRNVPDDDELLLGYAGGSPRVISPTRYAAEYRDPSTGLQAQLQQAAEPLLQTGGTERIEHADLGEIVVTVQPVDYQGSPGALVIANFLGDEYSELDSFIRTYAILALLMLGAIAVLSSFQAGRLLRPVRTLRETAQGLGATDLSRRIPEQGNDDITALTRTVNQMLDRLERAFRTQREFLDDAGHELKTPLTIMSGHLELLDPHDPEDVAATRELLLDETDRMSRLVRELILLAKLDRPDFLDPREVDVAPLTTRVWEKCRGLGERDWVLDAAAEVAALLDEQRITQAMVQLAQNATKHTEDGATIGVGSAYADGQVTFWVRDTGPGVRPEDRETIFERFGRGRIAAGDDGFGLGLSIVHGIATAHGGTLAVSDERPHGARFTLSLPVADAAVVPSPRKEDPSWPAS